MKTLYPILDKYLGLLPICWIVRALKNIITRKGQALELVKSEVKVSKDDIKKINNIREKVGADKFGL